MMAMVKSTVLQNINLSKKRLTRIGDKAFNGRLKLTEN